MVSTKLSAAEPKVPWQSQGELPLSRSCRRHVRCSHTHRLLCCLPPSEAVIESVSLAMLAGLLRDQSSLATLLGRPAGI